MRKTITILLSAALFAACGDKTTTDPTPTPTPEPEPESGLKKCSVSKITDDMIFSSCCARTTTSVQQGVDYDPVDNTIYFTQRNSLYRNLISWTTPKYPADATKASKTMFLNCFSHGNNIIIERAAEGKKYVWAPNFGTRESDGYYGEPWIVSRFPLVEGGSINNIDTDDNYYFGVNPCWPAIDFEEDRIAICTYKKVYVYKLSEITALPLTDVKIPATITYGGKSVSGDTVYDSGIPEFTGQPVVKAHDCTKITPLMVFDNDYSTRKLHWQTFCIDNGKAYFLDQADPDDDGPITHDAYIEVYDLSTGKLLKGKVRQNYIQDTGGLLSRGFTEPGFCYNEPEGIKVIGDYMLVLYTCRGKVSVTIRRPVVFKLSSEI